MSEIYHSNGLYRSMNTVKESKFNEFDERYSNIHKYINEFQVRVKKSSQFTLRSEPLEPKFNNDSKITVFKKKNLKNYCFSNIYEHNLSSPDIDANDSTKSKVSCMRCRRSKKRCTRMFPECSNCSSSDELCIYLPRKHKNSSAKSYVNDSKAICQNSHKNEVESPPIYSNQVIQEPLKYKKLSLPNILSPSHSIYFDPSDQRENYKPTDIRQSKDSNINRSKDLYKILN